MVSFSVRHVADTALSGLRVLPSRRKGASSGHVVATRRHYGIATSYQIDEQNGSALTNVNVVFPDAKYAALDYSPSRTGYRFLGWYDAASGGGAVSVSDQVRYGVSPIYAHWQDHVTVTFDATTNGGAMPSGWTAPYYFAGQPYGTLPTPTHASLNFGGWYDGSGNRVTASSIVPHGGVTLTARYVASVFSVDLNGGEWREQSPNSNPDPSIYAGVYESDKYHNSPPSEGCAVKMYINVVGYTSFRVYIRSHGENGWSYVVAMPVDEDPSGIPSSGAGDTSSDSTSTEDISGYKAVDYVLDGGAHRICILYRHGDSYVLNSDRGYVLIPLEQGGGS